MSRRASTRIWLLTGNPSARLRTVASHLMELGFAVIQRLEMEADGLQRDAKLVAAARAQLGSSPTLTRIQLELRGARNGSAIEILLRKASALELPSRLSEIHSPLTFLQDSTGRSLSGLPQLEGVLALEGARLPSPGYPFKLLLIPRYDSPQILRARVAQLMRGVLEARPGNND